MGIPLSPLPEKNLQRISQLFIPIALRLRKVFPNLEMQLKQADLGYNQREYLSIMVFLSLFYLVFFAILLSVVLSRITEYFLIAGITVSIIVSFFVLIQISMYPMMRIRKKQRDIEKNLLFALRTMLIEIKSGVSIFDAMKLIARSNYGELSKEFKKAVDEISTGAMYDESLQKLATNNPSPYFRKAIWQIVNGMKAGGDISDIIKETVKSAAREQRIAISKYSSQLRILSLGYMMVGVILPGLGLTLLVVIGTILGMVSSFKLDQNVFWIVLIAFLVMQFMYTGILKSRRPTIIQT